MSKNRNRAKLKKATSSKDYKVIQLMENYPLYWDEGWNYKISRLLPCQYRMYRSWKYNRKTQFKCGYGQIGKVPTFKK